MLKKSQSNPIFAVGAVVLLLISYVLATGFLFYNHKVIESERITEQNKVNFKGFLSKGLLTLNLVLGTIDSINESKISNSISNIEVLTKSTQDTIFDYIIVLINKKAYGSNGIVSHSLYQELLKQNQHKNAFRLDNKNTVLVYSKNSNVVILGFIQESKIKHILQLSRNNILSSPYLISKRNEIGREEIDLIFRDSYEANEDLFRIKNFNSLFQAYLNAYWFNILCLVFLIYILIFYLNICYSSEIDKLQFILLEKDNLILDLEKLKNNHYKEQAKQEDIICSYKQSTIYKMNLEHSLWQNVQNMANEIKFNSEIIYNICEKEEYLPLIEKNLSILSALENGILSPKGTVEVQLNDILDKVTSIVKNNLLSKGLKFQFEHCENITIITDGALLTLIIQYLISEAISLMSKGKSIEYSLSKIDNFVIIKILYQGFSLKLSTIEKESYLNLNRDEILRIANNIGVSVHIKEKNDMNEIQVKIPYNFEQLFNSNVQCNKEKNQIISLSKYQRSKK